MDRRPYVLHVITRIDGGGSAVNTMLSIDGLSQRGRRVRLITGSAPPETARRGDVTILPALRRDIHPWHDLRALFGLVRLIGHERPDILHVHSSKAGLLGRIAGRWCRVPRIVYTPHGHVFGGYFSPPVARFYLALERWAAGFTDRLVALTATERDEELALNIGRESRYAVIPSGVDLGRYAGPGPGPEARRRFGVPEDATAFGTLARLEPVKGVDIALRGFAAAREKNRDLFFLVAGDGAERSALERLADELGVRDHVLFTGWTGDPRAFFGAIDGFVLASRNEGMGRAAVEASAAGLPVIASAVGGLNDVVAGGETGLLFPPESADELGAAMLELAGDPDRRRKMGAAGRARAGLFSLEAMIDGLERLYDDLERER
ncbi:glycosyltransferase family 4 protein [Kiritimatiella glycovorans]|uniref:Glycosyltransferase group I n=1 Tax=Kiritimatiella glycovorans TaxID=1307763 RepID=A0A0G3EIB8_9BACT|nr:glycosyltransferase family 4 protein [Kiritimatiella glycovorans]AKJ63879.1 Glycosyltransferase group I [Kiritimatiella glycovorans]